MSSSFLQNFYIYDIKQTKFIKVQRADLSKLYTSNKRCKYCPCRRKCQSNTNLIKHLQVIESKFFCFLIFDRLEQNTPQNDKRILDFVNSIETQSKIGNSPMKKGYKEQSDSIENEFNFYDYNEELDEEDDIQSKNNAEDDDDQSINYINEMEDKNLILSEIKQLQRRNNEKMNNLFEQLKLNMNSSSLNQGVIDNQNKLQLCKRTEDFQRKEKDLRFIMQINLNYEDLDYLMKKYGISDNYQILSAEFSLILNLKDANSNEDNVKIKKLNDFDRSIDSNSSLKVSSSLNNQKTSNYYQSNLTTNHSFNSSKSKKEIVYEEINLEVEEDDDDNEDEEKGEEDDDDNEDEDKEEEGKEEEEKGDKEGEEEVCSNSNLVNINDLIPSNQLKNENQFNLEERPVIIKIKKERIFDDDDTPDLANISKRIRYDKSDTEQQF